MKTEHINLWAITLDFISFLLEKVKNLLLKFLKFLGKILNYSFYTLIGILIISIAILAVIVACCIVYPFNFLWWISENLNKIWENFLDFLNGSSEEINGVIVKTEDKYEPLFIPVFNYGNFDVLTFASYNEPVFIHHYVLTIKDGVKTYTVRVPHEFYKNVKKQIRKGIKIISLNCFKNDFEDVYELSHSSS